MSANLDLVRSIYADLERGDIDIDRFCQTASEWMHPDVEFVRPDGPEVGTWTGRERVVEVMRDINSTAEDYRELDGDRVLVLNKFSGRAKKSGMQMDQKGAEVFEIHDGRVTKIVQYANRDRALADLGLTLEGDTP